MKLPFAKKRVCVDCHFYLKDYRGHGQQSPLEIVESERDKSRSNDFSWSKNYALMCWYHVWDEGHNFDSSRKLEILTEDDRTGKCFFWKHRPSMLLPAAELLQERERNEFIARRDRKLTIYGLWIAAMALVANVWLKIAEKMCWWPF